MRPYQIGTAAAIVLIAAVAMFDTRTVFVTLRGTGPGDVGPSWYPFWAAAVMAAAGVGVAIRAYATAGGEEAAFAGRESVVAVLRLVIPMLAYAASFSWLGFYMATGAYMGLFAAWLGKYKWYYSVASAVLTPLLIFLMFEVGFKLLLPKSIFYQYGFPF